MRFALCFLLFVPSSFAATHTVFMTNVAFVPRNLTVNVGDTVTWRDTAGFHDTVSGSSGVPNGVWNSNSQYGRLMRPGETFSVTFTQAGSYPYFCTPHWQLQGMVGTIVVQGVNRAPAVSISSPADGATFSAPASITVMATASDADNDPVTVQFFLNGASLGEFTAPPYQVNVNDLGPGNYTFSATARDTAGANNTASVTVSVVGAAPVITSAPQSQTAMAGSDVLFSARAAGSPPLTYEWFFETNLIADAASSSLLLTNVDSEDAGIYTVRVSNEFGGATASATLAVTNLVIGTPPTITLHPQSQTVNAGSSAALTAAADGTPPLAWQWFMNGAPMAGATNESLVTSAAGDYFALVSNPYGFVQTAIATVTVCSYALSTNRTSFMAAGGTRTVNITALAGCEWMVVNENPWILVERNMSSIILTVLANPRPSSRTGTLLIAGNVFTVTQSGVTGDFDRDGHTDLLWHHRDGRVILWLMNGVNRASTSTLSRRMLGARIVGTHDFNADGHEDILWQRNSGAIEVWYMQGTQYAGNEVLHRGPGALWQLAGFADFNRDSHLDFLFRHRDGYVLLWSMQGRRVMRQQLLQGGAAVPPIWRIAGVQDIDNDGSPDIIWQHANSAIVVWHMSGAIAERGPRLSHLPLINARIVGAHDLNQDGSADFIWRHPDGRLTIWWMNRAARIGSFPINSGERVSAAMSFGGPRR